MDELERLKIELGDQKQRAEERLNQLRYLQADFETFRRRYDREKEEITGRANEKLISDLLVILDDLEYALPSLGLEKNRQGMEMVTKKLQKILSAYGLVPIECIGKKFDPHFHEVICTEKCEQEQGTVLEEIGKGYILKDKVIRPSKVKVAEHVMELKR